MHKIPFFRRHFLALLAIYKYPLICAKMLGLWKYLKHCSETNQRGL